MFSISPIPNVRPSVRKRTFPRYRDWLCFTSATEGMSVLDAIVGAMQRRGYAEKEIFGTRLAIEEALVNAVKHGNRGDPAKCVWASWHVGPNSVLVEIEDEGDGLDPRAVPERCVSEQSAT